MNKEELIGKLQMVYVGDKNALHELIGYYDGLKTIVGELQQENKKYKELIDTMLTFNLFGEECPLGFGFEKGSLQEKAQETFYENDGEYCDRNCDCNDGYKKCWLKFFNKIKELRGRENE